MRRHLAMAATGLVLLSGALPAQRDTARRPGRAQILPGGRGAARLNRDAARAGGQANVPLRQQVQQAFRARIRQELNLDQPKMRRLNQTEQTFNRQRSDLNRSERETRQALAAAMQDSTPDQGKIDQYIDQLVEAQRKRADLLEAEQKELSSFLTPMQRAKYLSLRERLSRRMQEMNPNGGRGAPPAGSPPGPPPAEPPGAIEPQR